LEALFSEELLDETVGRFMVWELVVDKRSYPGDELEAVV